MNVQRDDTQIIKQIIKDMKDRDITIRELSEKSSLAYSTIYDVLEGGGSPRLTTLMGICKALDLEIKVCKKVNNMEEDRLSVLISRLSKQKRKLVRDFIVLLDRYDGPDRIKLN